MRFPKLLGVIILRVSLKIQMAKPGKAQAKNYVDACVRNVRSNFLQATQYGNEVG